MPFDFKAQVARRPRKGDQLIRSDLPGDSGSARLRPAPGEYTLGYRRAAEHLVRFAVANQRECLVYPIVFLYRHHVELALKRIIYCAPGILKRELTAQESAHLLDHNLDLLWRDLEPIFCEICEAVNWDKPKRSDLEGARDYIRQLSELDPSSYGFRYWNSKKGLSSLPASLDTFNIPHFSQMMGRLADFIDGLDAATTAAFEMLSDLRDAY